MSEELKTPVNTEAKEKDREEQVTFEQRKEIVKSLFTFEECNLILCSLLYKRSNYLSMIELCSDDVDCSCIVAELSKPVELIDELCLLF